MTSQQTLFLKCSGNREKPQQQEADVEKVLAANLGVLIRRSCWAYKIAHVACADAYNENKSQLDVNEFCQTGLCGSFHNQGPLVLARTTLDKAPTFLASYIISHAKLTPCAEPFQPW